MLEGVNGGDLIFRRVNVQQAVLSEEVYYLDGLQEWTLSSQTTQHVDACQVPQQVAVLERPLNADAGKAVEHCGTNVFLPGGKVLMNI